MKVLVMGRVANFLFDDSSTNSVVVCQNAEIMKELGEEDPTGNEEEENSGPNSIYIDGKQTSVSALQTSAPEKLISQYPVCVHKRFHWVAIVHITQTRRRC